MVHRDAQRRLVVARVLDGKLVQRQRDTFFADAGEAADLQHGTNAVGARRRDDDVVDFADLVAAAADDLGAEKIGDVLRQRRRAAVPGLRGRVAESPAAPGLAAVSLVCESSVTGGAEAELLPRAIRVQLVAVGADLSLVERERRSASDRRRRPPVETISCMSRPGAALGMMSLTSPKLSPRGFAAPCRRAC